MIYIYIVVLEPSMLHAKFLEICPLVVEKKIFKRVFTIYGHGPHGGHLGHVTWISYIHIGSPFL